VIIRHYRAYVDFAFQIVTLEQLAAEVECRCRVTAGALRD